MPDSGEKWHRMPGSRSVNLEAAGHVAEENVWRGDTRHLGVEAVMESDD